jgi:uncharacterized phiE125 gp8 family phage protein
MQVITPAAGLPVTVARFRAAVPLAAAVDDETLAAYLEAAVNAVELASGRPMLARDLRLVTPAGPWRRWWFPVAPVLAVTLIEGGTAELLTPFGEPMLARDSGDAALTITATVGYVDADAVPAALKQAVILMAKDWLEAAVTLEEIKRDGLSFGAKALIKQQRYRRPTEVVPC